MSNHSSHGVLYSTVYEQRQYQQYKYKNKVTKKMRDEGWLLKFEITSYNHIGRPFVLTT